MFTLGRVPCPGNCGGRIRLYAAGAGARVTIEADASDIRRHSVCMAPPPDGEPLEPWAPALAA